MKIKASAPEVKQGNLASYCLGFILSLFLTILAYVFVVKESFPTVLMIGVVIVLALLQLFVQLVFFLHLDKESKPRWNLAVFAFMLMVVFIIVFGSLWIMYNLDYHHGGHHNYITPDQIVKDEGAQLY